ncbi:MAG: hypothetical protein NTU85_03455 [Candidatus Kaiserbacteria bacterium]|nr:hypothetical protein [Candidatus Kaiserbacteria bacterium]
MQSILSPDPALFNPEYLLYDSCADTLAAGAVNGTRAFVPSSVRVSSRNPRTVVDTNATISVGSGALNFATGAAANDGVWYPALTRTLGRVLIWRVTLADTNGILNVGWDNDASGALLDALQFAASGVLNVVPNGGTALALGAYTATTYDVAAVMRATGIKWFIRGGAFPYWTKLWTTAVGTAAGLPAANVGSATTSATATKPRCPRRTWMDVPQVSDGFGGTRTGLGSSDGLGHTEANGGAGVAWQHTAGVWALGSSKAVGTPTLSGLEILVNADFELAANWVAYGSPTSQARSSDQAHGSSTYSWKVVTSASYQGCKQTGLGVTLGNWMLYSAYVYPGVSGNHQMYRMDGSGANMLVVATKNATANQWSQIVGTARESVSGSAGVMTIHSLTAAETFYADDASIQVLTLASLIAVTPAATADIVADVTVTALAIGTQAGLCLRCNSQSAPASFILVYHNGANVVVDKCVSGTYSNLASTVATYSTSYVLRVVCFGSSVQIYYNNVLIGAELTISDTEIINNTLHGLFSTYSGNSLDNFVVWPRGTANEYAALDTM